jgi:hypothetical protein
MRILGIDPGVRGGLAIVEVNNGVAPKLVDAIDVPTVGIEPALSGVPLLEVEGIVKDTSINKSKTRFATSSVARSKPSSTYSKT